MFHNIVILRGQSFSIESAPQTEFMEWKRWQLLMIACDILAFISVLYWHDGVFI